MANCDINVYTIAREKLFHQCKIARAIIKFAGDVQIVEIVRSVLFVTIALHSF